MIRLFNFVWCSLILGLQYGTLVSAASSSEEHSLYGFHISTTAGSNLSATHQTEWALNGKLLIKSVDNYMIMKLKELETRTYNGPTTDTPPPDEAHPISKESIQILTEPFVVYYSDNYNNLESLKFSPNEPAWSANIKKSIASIFQVNFGETGSGKSNVLAIHTELDNGFSEHSHEEQNIYGACEVRYAKYNSNGEHVTISKQFDHSGCKSAFVKLEPGGRTGRLSGSTVRHYTFNRTRTSDDLIPLHSIASETILTYATNRHDRTIQEIKQTQLFYYLASWPTNPISDISAYTQTGRPDYETAYNERSEQVSQQTLLNRWRRFYEIYRKQTNRKESTTINKDDFNIVDKMYETLSAMDTESFKLIHTLASAQEETQMLNIFSALLSYVGSSSSLDFIKLHPEVRTLATFPFIVESPNRDMLVELEKLFETKQIASKRVKYTLVLSFANLVEKLYASKRHGLADIEVEIYATKYLKLFRETRDYSTRINYLLGIGNMGYSNGLTEKTLTSIIHNASETNDVRVLALNVLRSQHNYVSPTQVFETYWPLVKNSTETFPLRASALNLLLESNLPIQKLYNIMNYVNQGLDDPAERHLHNYFYTTMQAGKSRCENCTIKKYAKDILQQLKPPASNKGLMTGYYEVQYSDEDENFGLAINTHVIANPLTNFVNVYQITINWFNNYTQLHDLSLCLKAEGISKKFIKEYHEKHYPVQELFRMLQEAKIPLKTDDEDERVNIEIIVYFLGKAVYTLHVNEENADEIEPLISEIIAFLANNDILLLERYPRVSYVSDIGTPISVEYSQSQLFSTAFKNMDKIFVGDEHNNDDENYVVAGLRSVWNSKLNFLSHNPVTHTNIGISELYSNQKMLRLRVEYNVYDLYIKWSDDHSYIDVLIDYKHALFVDRDDDLKKTCPQCESFLFLTGSNKTTDTNLNVNLGVKNINVKTTNCSNGHFSLKEIVNKMRVNNVRYPLIQPVVLLVGTYDYLYHVPPYDTCSVVMRTKPALTEPNESQVKLNFNNDLFDDTFHVNLNFNVELTLIHRRLKDNKTLNQWNLNVLRQENAKGGHYELHFNDNAKTFKFDVNTNIEHIPTLPNRDMFSLWPAEPISSRTSIRYKEASKILTDINISTLFTVSDDKVRNKSENFQTCEEEFNQVYGKNRKKLKHVPPTKSCYAASLEMATYDNYKVDVNFKNVTKKLKELIETGLAFINEGPVENSVIRSNKFQVAISFYTTNSTLNVHIDGKEILSNYTVPEVIRPRALLKSSTKLFEEIKYNVYGLESVCIVTPYYINTFTEQTVNYDLTTAILPLIECNVNSRLGLITRSNENVDFKLWVDTDILVVRSKARNKYSITVNNKPYKKNLRDDDYTIEVMGDNTFHFTTKKIELYYNEEYILIKMKSALINAMCGICSSSNVTHTTVLNKYFP